MTKPQAGRAEREATALRANLHKRREQARLREQAPQETDQRKPATADAAAGASNDDRLPVSR
jgi:hypothetical protein